MMANPKFEITAVKPSGTEWIRISSKLVNDDSREAKAYVLDKNRSLCHGRSRSVLFLLCSYKRDKVLMARQTPRHPACASWLRHFFPSREKHLEATNYIVNYLKDMGITG